MSDPIEKAAVAIAIDLYGRPEKCSGWKAKIFNAAAEGAVRGIEKAAELRLQELGDDPDALKRARQCAVDVLMARLPRTDPGKRETLKARIALIRSGTGDGVPEVQTALLALGDGRAR